MKNTCLLVLLFTIFFFGNCHKNKTEPPDTLPPITQNGANTFGCKVDGEIWVPYYQCSFGNNPCGEVFNVVYSSNSQTILPFEINMSMGQKKSNPLTAFQINTKQGFNLNTIGNKIDSLTLSFVDATGDIYYYYDPYGKHDFFEISKIDTVNKIISGVFEMTLYKSLTDSVKISEGRFDLKFNVCKCSN